MLSDSHASAGIVSRSRRAPSRAAPTLATIETGVSGSLVSRWMTSSRRLRSAGLASEPAPITTITDSHDSATERGSSAPPSSST